MPDSGQIAQVQTICKSAPTELPYYISEEEIPAAGMASVLERAWHLRQRNPAQALELAALAEMQDKIEQARACLIRGEINWLFARSDQAAAELSIANALFAAAGDSLGCGDALMLHHHIAADLGDKPLSRQCLRQAAQIYQECGNHPRRHVALGWLAVDESFQGQSTTLDGFEPGPGDNQPQGEHGLLNFARAQLAFCAGDYATAQTNFQLAADELQNFGLIRQGIAAIINTASAFGNAHELQTQVSMLHQALSLARHTGWPQSMGAALYCLGDTHHSLGRLADARLAFKEARDWLAPLRKTRTYVTVVSFLAEVDARSGDRETATRNFADALEAARLGGHEVLMPRILIGQAECLSEMGRAEPAAQAALQALHVCAGQDDVTERLALLSLARLHGRYSLLAPPGMTEPSASLHYLGRLARMPNAEADGLFDEEVIGEFAAAFEREGDFRRALAFERRRLQASTSARSQQAEQQLLTIQARHDALMAQQEIGHHRRLLEIERQRQTVLEELGMIGLEITATPDAGDIIATVDRHLRAMLSVASVTLWLKDGDLLMPIFCRENGDPVQGPPVRLDDPHDIAARAARAPSDLSIADADAPAALPTGLFAPLRAGNVLHGVISIQPANARAYGDNERLIFRNICAYTAIALANASNYRELRASHEDLLRAQGELETLARVDPLTGLWNRRHFFDIANTEILRAERTGGPIYVLMIDIDHFKKINDTHGHSVGDIALETVAKLISENLRPHDTVARYGGEEIVVLFPDATVAAAEEIGERLRASVANHRFDMDEVKFGITISIGIAVCRADETTITPALGRADKALYLAKDRGRNNVCVAAEA